MVKPIHIVKIGGKVAEHDEQLSKLLDWVARQTTRSIILVHGGGVKASEMAQRLGVETTMVEGRRVTNEAMLEIATMVYGGLINKKIVAHLEARSTKALGLTGADLGLIRSVKRPPEPIDFGLVGDIVSVNTDELRSLLARNIIPVIAPLTSNGQGQLLNTNADSIAAHVASSLAGIGNEAGEEYSGTDGAGKVDSEVDYEVHLDLCFDLEGVMVEGEVVKQLNSTRYKTIQEQGHITGGMIPKLDLGFMALEAGVKHVRILSPEGVPSHSSGTLLSKH